MPRRTSRGSSVGAVAAVACSFACGPPNAGQDKPPVPEVDQMIAAVTARDDAEAEAPPRVAAADRKFLGEWRAVLRSPGGGLPFGLVIEPGEGGGLRAFMANGDELAPFSSVRTAGNELTLEVEGYDSRIVARGSGQGLSGEWTKTVPAGTATMKFSASPGPSPRFLPVDELPVDGAPASVAGSWALTFTEKDGTSFPGRAEWTDGPRSTVRGTILTDTGDFRYLEGRYDAGHLRLSVFDGAHAFLFRASWVPGEGSDDGTLRGDFWSRDDYHATFVGRRLGAGEADGLPDPFEVVGLTSKDGRFRFAFPDHANPGGPPITEADSRFAGKVVVVDLFGTWCPNCNDQAELLSQWHKRWKGKGLAIVGIAFEMTGDASRDAEMVRRYAARHGVDYPLLLAATSDKDAAAASLPDLSRVASFPTTVFIGRDGRVRRIYSGYAGPATGEHHATMVEETEALVKSLLAETPSGPGE